jgi:hypothetical protein
MQNFNNKKKKTKNKTAKLIANQYLSNICLNDSINEDIFNDENIEKHKYRIFLYLNTIKSNKFEQTDYFNCYKEKLREANSNKTQVLDFINKEFQTDENSSSKLVKLDSVETEYFEAIQRKNDNESAKVSFKQQNHRKETNVSFHSKQINILTK